MVRAVLSSAGHEVGLVSDGRAALASVQEREPDLLLLDLMMPGVSGLDACRTVKANPFTARIPILMLTGESHIDRKVEGFEAGADDYLAKPFDPRELRARVNALLRLVRREADRNPTSGLPGGRAIEEEILRRVAADEACAVCYLDIDYFKPFADTFGFAAADAVIRGTGAAVIDAVAAAGDSQRLRWPRGRRRFSRRDSHGPRRSSRARERAPIPRGHRPCRRVWRSRARGVRWSRSGRRGAPFPDCADVRRGPVRSSGFVDIDRAPGRTGGRRETASQAAGRGDDSRQRRVSGVRRPSLPGVGIPCTQPERRVSAGDTARRARRLEPCRLHGARVSHSRGAVAGQRAGA